MYVILVIAAIVVGILMVVQGFNANFLVGILSLIVAGIVIVLLPAPIALVAYIVGLFITCKLSD